MTKLYAQPYDITAHGFYFEDMEEYHERRKSLRNAHGDPVEEFEIQFIDGEAIDCALAQAWGLNQANIAAFFNAVEEWDDQDKQVVIIAVGEVGYNFDPETISPDDFDIDIYHARSMVDLAEEFVAEGLFGDIPDYLTHYIDYEAIARDLACDYCETEIAGHTLIYRAA